MLFVRRFVCSGLLAGPLLARGTLASPGDETGPGGVALAVAPVGGAAVGAGPTPAALLLAVTEIDHLHALLSVAEMMMMTITSGTVMEMVCTMMGIKMVVVVMGVGMTMSRVRMAVDVCVSERCSLLGSCSST